MYLKDIRHEMYWKSKYMDLHVIVRERRKIVIVLDSKT